MIEVKIFDSNRKIKSSIKDVELCSSVCSKAKGLMFARKPRYLFFSFKKETKISLHMFFVFFPIDLVFLNNQMEVVEIKKDFKPWTFYKSKNKSRYVIEMPSEGIDKNGIAIGDIIEII